MTVFKKRYVLDPNSATTNRVDDVLPFDADTVRIDNYTSQYLHERNTDQYIAPKTYRAALYTNTSMARLEFAAPAGTPQPAALANEQAIIYYEGTPKKVSGGSATSQQANFLGIPIGGAIGAIGPAGPAGPPGPPGPPGSDGSSASSFGYRHSDINRPLGANASYNGLYDDEFNAPALANRWSWVNPPDGAHVVYDIDTSIPSHLRLYHDTFPDVATHVLQQTAIPAGDFHFYSKINIRLGSNAGASNLHHIVGIFLGQSNGNRICLELTFNAFVLALRDSTLLSGWVQLANWGTSPGLFDSVILAMSKVGNEVTAAFSRDEGRTYSLFGTTVQALNYNVLGMHFLFNYNLGADPAEDGVDARHIAVDYFRVEGPDTGHSAPKLYPYTLGISG